MITGTALVCAVLVSSTPALPSRQAAKADSKPASYAAFRIWLGAQDRLTHALDRLTFGARPGDFDRLQQLGLNKWIDEQLHPERESENPILEQRLASLTSLNLSISEAFAQYQPPQNAAQLSATPAVNRPASKPRRVLIEELNEAKLLRAIYSNHQLAELLDDFWFNHFNVFANKGLDRYSLPTYEREAIRPHIFGHFYDLLLATAESPAMLFYLDNWQSVGPQEAQRPGRVRRGLNENYGRELLELHTLGVDGGYTQSDVIAVARCFTGWTITRPREGGGFQYNDRVHDKGEKIVLGRVLKAGGGMNDGLEVLAILAASPATAHHISYEMAQRFVADKPPPSLVDRMTKSYLKTNGDLREVTRTMLRSPEFWSRGAYQAKIKTAFEMVVSAVRATQADVSSGSQLARELQKLGEPLYRKLEPNGYSNVSSEWASSAALLERMNFSLALANDRVSGAKVDTAIWNAPAQSDPLELAHAILGRNPSNQTSTAILRMLASAETQQKLAQNAGSGSPQLPGLIVGLTLGSPDFQHR